MNLNITKAYQNVKTIKPLVHHITNYVTANDCANTVLAIGGRPVMADAIEEVAAMVAMASALVINLGTLKSHSLDAMLVAGKKANELNIPIILDPVGVGATPFRTRVAKKLLKELKFACIKGNASEILNLFGYDVTIKGVDALENFQYDLKSVAIDNAKTHRTVVCITGKIDIISDGIRSFEVMNGHKRLSHITGTGCMTTSIIATFIASKLGVLPACIIGISLMGIAGECANNTLGDKEGLASFKIAMMDFLSTLDPETLNQKIKLKEGD